MFGMKRKPTPETFQEPYRIVEETKDFVYFQVQPGRPVTVQDIQRMKDEGFRMVHVETKTIAFEIQSWVLCEKIK